MLQAGNQECSNLCLVLAGGLPTARVFCQSQGALAGLGVVQLQVRNTVRCRAVLAVPGVLPPRAKLPRAARAAGHMPCRRGARSLSRAMLSAWGEGSPGGRLPCRADSSKKINSFQNDCSVSPRKVLLCSCPGHGRSLGEGSLVRAVLQ